MLEVGPFHVCVARGWEEKRAERQSKQIPSAQDDVEVGHITSSHILLTRTSSHVYMCVLSRCMACIQLTFLLLWEKGRMYLGDKLESGTEVKTATFVGNRWG